MNEQVFIGKLLEFGMAKNIQVGLGDLQSGVFRGGAESIRRRFDPGLLPLDLVYRCIAVEQVLPEAEDLLLRGAGGPLRVIGFIRADSGGVVEVGAKPALAWVTSLVSAFQL